MAIGVSLQHHALETVHRCHRFVEISRLKPVTISTHNLIPIYFITSGFQFSAQVLPPCAPTAEGCVYDTHVV